MKNLKKHEPTWTQLTLPLEYLPQVNQNPIKLNHGKASIGVNKANINQAVIIEESCIVISIVIETKHHGRKD